MEDLRKLCESPFERELYDELTQRGYWVTPQVKVGQYRIDMVVEGHNDARWRWSAMAISTMELTSGQTICSANASWNVPDGCLAMFCFFLYTPARGNGG